MTHSKEIRFHALLLSSTTIINTRDTMQNPGHADPDILETHLTQRKHDQDDPTQFQLW